jgi:polyisoprenoid-binding protein YceI
MRILLLLPLAAAFLFGQNVPIAPGAGTKVEAIVEKTGLMSGKKHLLSWEKFSGEITMSPAKVVLTVDAASVRVLDDWIDEGKKEDVRKEAVGKNVLYAEKYPQVRFVSTRVSGDTAGEFQVTGELTVRGVAKTVTLAVKRTEAGYEGETKFPMTDFGVKPPKALLGLIGTKDEMTIRFRVEASR